MQGGPDGDKGQGEKLAKVKEIQGTRSRAG